MKSSQYTIRSIPPQVDAALRRRARETGKSLNQVLLDALTKGAGVTTDVTYADMDWFIGGKALDKSFDGAAEWLDEAPKDLS